MNFQQFLKKENIQKENKEKVENKQIKVEKKEPEKVQENKENKEVEVIKIGKNKQKKFINNNINQNEIKNKLNKEEAVGFFNPNDFIFKKGDFVKVIRTPKTETFYRMCDIYMGYFGEIKELNVIKKKGDQITARVSLEATNSYIKINIPLDCLVKRDN